MSICALFYTNCSKIGFAVNDLSGDPSSLSSVNGGFNNSISIDVGCGIADQSNPDGYLNEPCVAVTLCEPGTSRCEVVRNILLDTGSYGLRVFKSAIKKINLPGVYADSAKTKTLAECIRYGVSDDTETSQWGRVSQADVHLGDEVAANVRIHLIEATYPHIPADCHDPDPDPGTASGSQVEPGFNGILGVGPVIQDDDGRDPNGNEPFLYYACSSQSCEGLSIPGNQQVSNPLASFPLDNNGVIVQLPNVPANVLQGSSNSFSGKLIFGIGTRSNNQMPGSMKIPLDRIDASFQGTLNNQSATAFFDTGSNLDYVKLGLPLCASADLTKKGCSASDAAFAEQLYCPSGKTKFRCPGSLIDADFFRSRKLCRHAIERMRNPSSTRVGGHNRQ